MDARFVGRVLRLARERAGLTQAQAAALAGVSEARVASWETGRDLQTAANVLTLLFSLPANGADLRGTAQEKGVAMVDIRALRLPGAATFATMEELEIAHWRAKQARSGRRVVPRRGGHRE